MEIRYQIPRHSLIWVLASVVMALAPHVTRLPVWISFVALVCIGWRVLIFTGRLDYPGKKARVLAVILILTGSASQLRSLEIGLDVAASLLALGFIFKLVEMQSKRDIYVVLSLGFVMAVVSLLYSQSMATAMYLSLMVIVIIGGMVSLNRASMDSGGTSTLGIAVRITAQSLPLMIVLFMVFPRIGPLWAVPNQSMAATGVSDEMSPGDISQLAQSADLAFRVTFENGPPPLHQNLYWRGLVLDFFDGVTWRRQGQSALSAAAANAPVTIDYRDRVSVAGRPLTYNIILEPSHRRWIYGLHLAEALTPGITGGRNFELINRTAVGQRFSYDLRSYPDYQTDLLLLDSARRRSLTLPATGNPRSRELALSLRAGEVSDRDYVYRVLALFQQQFVYTLSPPLLGAERVDEFLFDTRAGYCEHYASAFTFMMRAAGIPARVVVGYQGGEYNRFEDYMMVYQYNAHAWSEVWLAGEGWVRIDPTSIVAPERISDGVEAALGDDPAFMNDSRFSLARFRNADWLNTLRLRLDAVEYAWNRRVVSYGVERQLRLFERWFGAVSASKVTLVLLASSSLALALVALFSIARPPSRRGREVDRLYQGYCDQLATIGLHRSPGEGPSDYLSRVVQQRPDLSGSLEQITGLYMEIAYEPQEAVSKGSSPAVVEFRKALGELRSRLGKQAG
jgi:transglutaminase-like putative cysteine protease